jgi:hypothetical protein
MKNIMIGCFLVIIAILVALWLAWWIMNAIRIMITNTL